MYDYDNLKSDEHVFHMWEPLDFNIKNNYKYIIDNPVFNIFKTLILMPIGFILFIVNKIAFGYKIINKEKLTNGGCISVSNHIHPMDCTMIGLIYYPKSIYYPTIQSNFKIPIIRHLIRLLGAIPIPDKKDNFYKSINKALNENKTIHMYPEGSMWPYYEQIREFKYGAFKMAVDANKCIQPIRFDFTKPTFYKRKKCIHAVILKPIKPDNNLEYKERIADLRNRTYEALKVNK